jgi:hypothetical protein
MHSVGGVIFVFCFVFGGNMQDPISLVCLEGHLGQLLAIRIQQQTKQKQ